MLGFIGGVLVIAAVAFWLWQVLEVISMKDEEFEGRNDKLIFFLFVFFGSIFGAIWFWLWRLRPSPRFECKHYSGLKPEEEKKLEEEMKAVLEAKRGKADGT